MKKRITATTGADLSLSLGPDWAGFTLTRAGLQVPGWRRPFTPGELQATFWTVQELGTLRAQVRQLQSELARRNEEFEDMERRAYWYRSQVRLEASLGLALARIAG
jgi:hypothetical protein